MNDVDALLDQALTEKSDSENIQYLDIDPYKRIIESKELLLGVQSDEKSERIYFKVPKIVGDELDLMNPQYKLFINYENAEGVRDAYMITDRVEDGEFITFSWLLSRLVTNVKGTVKFSLCVKKSQANGLLSNEWNTTIAIGEVLDGLEATEFIVEYSSNVIMQIIERLEKTESDVIKIKTSVDILDNKIKKTDIGNRNLLRDEWFTCFLDGATTYLRNGFLDKINYTYNGSAIYFRDDKSSLNDGFYCNNIAGMLPSTDYIISFKARRKPGSPKIDNIVIGHYVNHVKDKWFYDSYEVGTFQTGIIYGFSSKWENLRPMDDYEWHDFLLEFTTSSQPESDEQGDIFCFNGFSTGNAPCTIEIADMQWKKAENYSQTWTRPIEDLSSVNLNQSIYANTQFINLLHEKWLSQEPIESDEQYIDKRYYLNKQSFTYVLKTPHNRLSGLRITHVNGMRPLTKYIVSFKMRLAGGAFNDILLLKNFNHTTMNWYLDGHKLLVGDIYTPNYFSTDINDTKYHRVLLEFTTAEKIEMTINSKGRLGDMIRFNSYDNSIPLMINVVDFLWMDVDQNEDLYQLLIYNRQIFENRNLLRSDWLTDCQVEVK